MSSPLPPNARPVAAADGPLIAAHDVSIAYGGRTLVEAVTLAVSPGEIVTLIGPNGSGKTTLLRALIGSVAPARGRVVRRPGLRIGYVPQHFPRDRSLPLTVRGLLALLGGADVAAIGDALGRTGAAHLAGHDLFTLSGGEFARVLLARAIVAKPDLLLLDEPLAGVDLAGEAALYRLIAELRHEIGCGVLLVSHDLHIVMAQADRVVCLNRHVCCEGTPGAVVKDPAFVQLFGPRVARELAFYAHDHDHRHDAAGVAVPRDLAHGHSHG